MNQWNQLLVVLDRLFSYGQKVSSTIKKTGEGYDKENGERVVTFEYRVRMADQSSKVAYPVIRELIEMADLDK